MVFCAEEEVGEEIEKAELFLERFAGRGEELEWKLYINNYLKFINC